MADKKLDILIVGSGLAGSTLALELQALNQNVHLLDNQKTNSSSRVAAGLLNPIVPKGVRKTWQCDEIFPSVYTYYQKWEFLLEQHFIDQYPFLNIHANDAEAAEWQKQTNNPDMASWLTTASLDSFNTLPHNMATWVLNCGRLDVCAFLRATQQHFQSTNQYSIGEFDHSKIQFEKSKVIYQNNIYQSIIFCEGIGITENPWFNYLFFDPTGGDILKVRIKQLFNEPCIIKQKQWLIPTQEEDVYLLGSNFHKNNPNVGPNINDAQTLIKRAEYITGKPVELIEHKRGVRPTVQNRRPYLGEHPKQKGIFVYNGLGAKGSSLCSWLSPMMAKHVCFAEQLNPEVCLSRITL